MESKGVWILYLLLLHLVQMIVYLWSGPSVEGKLQTSKKHTKKHF